MLFLAILAPAGGDVPLAANKVAEKASEVTFTLISNIKT